MKTTKSFSIKNVKYVVPDTVQNQKEENALKILERWPSHSAEMHTDENIRVINNQITFSDPTTTNLLSRKSKPTFLHSIEKFISQEFLKHSIRNNVSSPVKLQVYREVFDKITKTFQTYKPILSKIKQEYEWNISMLIERIHELEPLKEILWTIENEREQTVIALRNKENKELERLLKENETLRIELEDEKALNESFLVQVEKLKNDISAEYQNNTNLVDSKKLICLDNDSLKQHVQALLIMLQNKAKKEDPTLLRMSLEVAKEDHAKAVDELMQIKANFYDYVTMDTYNNLKEQYDGIYMGYQEALKFHISFKKELDALKDEFKALEEQRDFYYLKFMESQSKKDKNKSLNVDAIANKAFSKYPNMTDQKTTKFKLKTLADKLELQDQNSTKTEPINTESSSEMQRIAMITKIEIICNLLPGSIPKDFDPNDLLLLLRTTN